MGKKQKYSHRTETKTIKLVDEKGLPLVNQKVQLSQKNHEFLFACGAFDIVPFRDEIFKGKDESTKEKLKETLIKKWLKLFNAGTLPFYWGQFEPEQGKPFTKQVMDAANFLIDNGVTVKGHPLCWHTQTAPWLLDMSNEEILKVQLDRIKRDVTDFKGVIDMWDVINEVVIMPNFDKGDNGITRICKEMGRFNLIKEVFAATKEANPQATLLINDFDTTVAYEILIEGCLDAGVPIDAIGIQSHQHKGYWGLEKTNEILERFSKFGLPLHFTENTLISGKLVDPSIGDLNDYQVDEWPTTPEGEERQAKEVVMFYESLFEHPLVESITTWSIIDGKWLGAPAGLIRVDGSSKPSYDALLDLIKNQWWTTETLNSDEQGNVTFTGYRGEYEITSQGRKSEFTLSKDESIDKIIMK